jgi:CheY-like chemotaxis protein
LKILLVEDSKVLADRLTEVIGGLPGVDLILTTDAEAAALALLRKEDVDVILLDLHLKQGTGFGVLRAVAAEKRKTTVIVLTNYDLPEFRNAARALGATHFLDKARDYWRLTELLGEIGNKHALH